jgi:hypothetical protein
MWKAVNVPHKGRDITDAARWAHGLCPIHDAHLAV